MIRLSRIPAALVGAGMLMIAGCSEQFPAKHLQPLSYRTLSDLKARDMTPDAPILIRIFKDESTLEVWKRTPDGRFAHFKNYEICKWSGELGPKIKEGDRQAPEGFYTVKPVQMNPWSNYYLSFNIGYPNIYDEALDRTGTYLMVHGACSSAGCYSMTDEQIAEIYALMREAFDGGQEAVQIQAYPFRLTQENLERYKNHRWRDFWRNLKDGYDAFEQTRQQPVVTVCGKRYQFNATFLVPDEQIDPGKECPPVVQAGAPDAAPAASAGTANATPVPVLLPRG